MQKNPSKAALLRRSSFSILRTCSIVSAIVFTSGGAWSQETGQAAPRGQPSSGGDAEAPPTGVPATTAPATTAPAATAPATTAPATVATPTSPPATPRSASPGGSSEFRALVGQAGGLTSDEAAREAAAYSQEAKVAEADQASANAQRAKTIFNYAPKVTLTASYTRISVPESTNLFGDVSLVGTGQAAAPLDPTQLFPIDSSAFSFNQIPNQYYLNAGVVIPISDYLLNMTQSLDGVRAAKKTAKLTERAARVSAASNARLAYYEWVRAKLAQGEADKSLERAKEQYKLLQNLAAGGRVARADVLRQDAFVANSELNVRRAATQEAIARQSLHMMMNGGKGKTPTWRIGEDVLREQAGDSVNAGDVERYHQEALRSRLEVQALDSTVYALDKQKSVEKTRALPRVEGFGNLTYANPNPRYIPQQDEWHATWDVGVRAVWTLNDIGAASSDAQVTSAEVARTRAQKQQFEDALRTEVLSAHQGLQEAQLALESAERGVAAAEAAHEDRRKLFEAGRATAFDVLDAETTLVGARLNLIQAYVGLRMARVRFDHALGRDVGDDALAQSGE
jgi:outer membrane protein TolC